MPDLGPYAASVLAAYGVTALLLAALILRSLQRNAAARKRLAELERDR